MQSHSSFSRLGVAFPSLPRSTIKLVFSQAQRFQLSYARNLHGTKAKESAPIAEFEDARQPTYLVLQETLSKKCLEKPKRSVEASSPPPSVDNQVADKVYWKAWKMDRRPSSPVNALVDGSPQRAEGDAIQPSTALEKLQSLTKLRPQLFPTRKYLSPGTALRHWLSLKDSAEKQAFFQDVWPILDGRSIHTVIFFDLNKQSVEQMGNTSTMQAMQRNIKSFVGQRGFVQEDIDSWAWILSGNDPDEMLDRFFQSKSSKPNTLLLLILQWDIQNIHILRKVITYFWEEVLDERRHVSPPIDGKKERDTVSATTGPSPGMDGPTFMRLTAALIRQGRRIWPASLLSISHFLGRFFDLVMNEESADMKKLDPKTYKRFCDLHNQLIRLFALPASIEPFKSMRHNWSAERVLLELGERYDPPLLLDEQSYKSIISVLTALPKSPRESRVAMLRAREWPPWRVAQDGMDAQRTPADDMSRVIAALSRKRLSGYRDRAYEDLVLRILGGQELDETPTIHTRSFVPVRAPRPQFSLRSDMSPEEMHPKVWAARIEATRDVQEAWSAFLEYKDRDGRPSMAMYFAMFKKLIFETARIEQRRPSSAVPGDGLEVLPVADNNLSNFYKSHIQPPSLADLYRQMMEAGIRPTGRCLDFLLEHAPSIHQGLLFLRDSKTMDNESIAWLAGDPNASSTAYSVPKISSSTFGAFLSLLCRSAPRSTHDLLKLDNGTSSQAGITIKATKFLELKDCGISRPLWHAASLLKKQQATNRPAWYSLFESLSRSGAVIIREEAGKPENDLLAWRVLIAALGDFRSLGLELDPRGFQLLCFGFLKSSPALKSGRANPSEFSEGLLLLKQEWADLSRVSSALDHLPSLSHMINGAHIHAYVRAIGDSGDYNELISVLKWVLNFKDELYANGSKLMRRVFVAMSYYLKNTLRAEEAEELYEASDIELAWPGDDELEEYAGKGKEKGL